MSALLVHELPVRPGADFADLPRPEYPQPQFAREDWLNLNGSWEFEFDDDDLGLDDHWAESGHDFSRTILVPFCFESPASGIHDSGDHPRAWYRRQFVVPEEWEDRRLLLHFGAVDYRATVWVNGRLAGEHEGGNTPFKFEIGSLLQQGSNTITVRVEDPPQDRYIPRGKQHWQARPESIFYTRTTGIWQTVWLEPVGTSYLDAVRIDSTLDGAVMVDARVARPGRGLEFRVEMSFDGRLLSSSTNPVESSQATAGAFLRDPRWWSPGSPNLYDIKLELLKDGRVVDRVTSYFGFRSITAQAGKVLLNGEPCYLKMVLDQGYWPNTNLTPPSDEAIQYDIRTVKEMGFNGVRKHQKVEDPRFLYWADRMGLLVSAEMANSYMFDQDSAARITREWLDAVARDYNHPSIIMWVPLNESWGVPNIQDPRQRAHIQAMYKLTKSLDSSRLVIDNDGWEHTSSTDLFAVHDYSHDGDLFYERFKPVEEGHIPIPFQGKLFLAPGFEYNGSPIFLSEFGGISYVPNDHSAPANSWGYEGLEDTGEGVLARMRSLYEAVAKLPKIAGICYTQLTDVEQEVNGLLSYDRKPKFNLAAIRRINALLR